MKTFIWLKCGATVYAGDDRGDKSFDLLLKSFMLLKQPGADVNCDPHVFQPSSANFILNSIPQNSLFQDM